ncbi:type II toxin-antitoxin system HicB family antitoxin [Methylocaldum sp.]|uniref:type II toxin-antitoxin system HicB family antitoxin n=1 Tax=Methylocaldum sp. TaxID=1969727 RepID=UPI002D4E2BBE|nr:type II toxin-antitoxin system HicB family antitoxin [Methylocaldum sp.]HYE34639.1 type II toxin-antitoxin system HicB family antitoxin [Methylocaldum sp.]
MRYPIAIEPGDDTHAFGVVAPDLPGCFSAGDSLDEALANAEDAILGWMEAMLDQGGEIPKPSTLSELREVHPEYRDWVWAVVTVDPAALDDSVERVNITLPRRVLHRLDARAKAAGESRSGFIAKMTLS